MHKCARRVCCMILAIADFFSQVKRHSAENILLSLHRLFKLKRAPLRQPPRAPDGPIRIQLIPRPPTVPTSYLPVGNPTVDPRDSLRIYRLSAVLRQRAPYEDLTTSVRRLQVTSRKRILRIPYADGMANPTGFSVPPSELESSSDMNISSSSAQSTVLLPTATKKLRSIAGSTVAISAQAGSQWSPP